MTAPYLYYLNPFGVNADDLTAIPVPAAGDGSVSYYAGWTDPYEQDLTIPTALPIPRGQMNQLFYDITNNLQEYQQYGSPQWVVGNTVSYPIYSRVYYSGQVYESQIGANTNTPGADTTWLKISANVNGIQSGMLIDSASYATPSGGYLYCDGTAYSRSTYAVLLAAIISVQTGTLTNTMPQITGLSNTAILYVGMPVEGLNVPSGTTILSIDSSSQVTMTHNATGGGSPQNVFFYPWGNGDGSTTFNVPDFRRKTRATSGGTGTAVLGNALGQTGGTETNTLTVPNLPPHSHTYNAYSLNSPGGTQIQGGTPYTQTNTSTPTGNGSGTSTPVNNVQPTGIVYTFIKT